MAKKITWNLENLMKVNGALSDSLVNLESALQDVYDHGMAELEAEERAHNKKEEAFNRSCEEADLQL